LPFPQQKTNLYRQPLEPQKGYSVTFQLGSANAEKFKDGSPSPSPPFSLLLPSDLKEKRKKEKKKEKETMVINLNLNPS